MLEAAIIGKGIRTETREYGPVTRSLTELKDWLLENKVTPVVMKSTGVYWKPVYHVLEPFGLTVWLVNVRHVKNVPGHKMDQQDDLTHQGDFYHACYHRLAARRGKKRTAVSVGHSILKSAYYILMDGVPYNELGEDYLNSRIEKRRRRYLQSELGKMGYRVQLSPFDPVNSTG